MDGICAMLKELVGTYQVIKGSKYLFTPPREVVGKCPRCGGEIAEMQKGFFCQDKSCKFAIWKNSKWWGREAQAAHQSHCGGAAQRWSRPCDRVVL